jgi:hypothetical protein
VPRGIEQLGWQRILNLSGCHLDHDGCAFGSGVADSDVEILWHPSGIGVNLGNATVSQDVNDFPRIDVTKIDLDLPDYRGALVLAYIPVCMTGRSLASSVA